MIEALIFDFDGLILDTEAPDFQSWEEMYSQHGCALAFERWAECIGRASGAFDPYAELEAQLGRALDRDAIRARRRARYLELVVAQAILPGIESYIRDARRLGLKLAVASSGSRDWVVGHLARLDLARHFACVRTAADVTHAKPDPELYLSALDALGVPPEGAIALEDSPNGMLAARRAGLFCVAVPNPLTCRLDLSHADLQLASLAELPLPDLLRLAAERRKGD